MSQEGRLAPAEHPAVAKSRSRPLPALKHAEYAAGQLEMGHHFLRYGAPRNDAVGVGTVVDADSLPKIRILSQEMSQEMLQVVRVRISAQCRVLDS
jgi:hypothetical protein